MWCGGKFFCGVGQPNVVTRIKCGDPCINFGVAISSREETPPPPNTPTQHQPLPLILLGKGETASWHCVQGSGHAESTVFSYLYKAMILCK